MKTRTFIWPNILYYKYVSDICNHQTKALENQLKIQGVMLILIVDQVELLPALGGSASLFQA